MWPGPQINVLTWIFIFYFFLFLNQNICCRYSKEMSQNETGFFEYPKHMFRLLGKEIIAILRWKYLLNWTNVWHFGTYRPIQAYTDSHQMPLISSEYKFSYISAYKLHYIVSGVHSAIDSGSDCWSRDREFDPGQAQYFRGDWWWNIFYSHSPPSVLIHEVTSESKCNEYCLTT